LGEVIHESAESIEIISNGDHRRNGSEGYGTRRYVFLENARGEKMRSESLGLRRAPNRLTAAPRFHLGHTRRIQVGELERFSTHGEAASSEGGSLGEAESLACR
jgi:hypothetical protein